MSELLADSLEAILTALAEGDTATADAIAEMSPEEVAEVFEQQRTEAILREGFTGTTTDSAGHKRHYVDGKQVAAAPKGSENQGNRAKATTRTAHEVTQSLAEFAKYNPKEGHNSEEYSKPAQEAHHNATEAAKAAKAGDYRLAAEYHKDAADAHDDAADAHEGYAGTDTRHSEAAKLHRLAAKKHREASEASKA